MNRTDLIRPAMPNDLASLAAIERAAGTLFPAGRIPDVDDVMPLDQLAQGADAGLLLVATSEDMVVGFAMAQEQGACLHLAVMAVHPAHARRGLGRRLVLAIVDEAARRKRAGVTLTTFDDLPWNGPFYRRAGFRVLGDEELSPALRNVLAQEESMGMSHRVAMLHTPNHNQPQRPKDD
jgi:GNAT superfamily N-acetyltransferase